MTHPEDATHDASAPFERGVRPLAARLDVLRVLLAERHPEHHAAVSEAQAEISRLTAALKIANDQAERFERAWYLRGDDQERALALLARYRDETPLGHQPHMIAHEADEVLGRVA